MRLTLVLLGDGHGPSAPADVEVIRAGSRVEGWKRATGNSVAFFDTRYEAGAEWLHAVCEATGTTGGYVLQFDRYSWSGWLYYVVEYGWKRRLAAANIVQRRGEAIDEWDPGPGKHDPRMDVQLARPPGVSEYVRERYRFSFAWGAKHVRPAAAILRLGLPVLVLARVPWWRRPSTLPGVMGISLVMACGEIAGSLMGRSAKVKAG